MKIEPFYTERLKIRSMKLSDAEFAIKNWNDEEAGKYMIDEKYESANHLRFLLIGMDEWEDIYMLTAEDKNSKETVGTCCIGKEDGKIWSIGYTVDKDKWNRNYGTEIVKALVTFAIKNNINILEAEVAKANTASKRVLEKCGFKIYKESSFQKRKTDIIHPSYIYRLVI
ncbi:MAG: GNAT family N-acetyltransferase [Tissierellia bacterium]|nr:GNAT family N-acetyltransferase [Tissierellia bacterium]